MTKKELKNNWTFVITVYDEHIAQRRKESLAKLGFEVFIWKYKRVEARAKYSIYTKK